MIKRSLIKRTAMILLSFVLAASNSVCLYADEDITGNGTQEGEGVMQENREDGPSESVPSESDPSESVPSESDPSESAPSEAASTESSSTESASTESGEGGNGEDEPAADVYKITVDNTRISFGTVNPSDTPRPLSFTVTNEGTEEVLLGWSQTDTEGLFVLNMPSNVNIPIQPSQAIQGSVEIGNRKLSPGDYSTTLMFKDLDHMESTATIDVSLRVENTKPVITRVSVTPDNVSLRQGNGTKFSASVEGENSPDTSVRWEVQGNNSSGTGIDSNGSLTIASDETAGSVKVVAISRQDESFSDSAVVNIAKDKYTVNADVYPSEAGYINGRGTFNGGDTTTLTAVANKGYEFSEWLTKDDAHVSYSASFTTDRIDRDLRYKAVFIETGYEIKVKSGDKHRGTVKGGGYVEKGGSVWIEAKPKDGYRFNGWYEKDRLVSRDEAKLKITNVKKEHTFTAEFAKERYVVSVSASPSEGGTVTGGGEYKNGESASIKAKANEGYRFKGYVLNNQIVSTSPDYKIKNIDRDLSITAYFEKEGAVNHTITAGVANKGGAITPSGDISVTKGNSITFTIAPDNGYAVLMVAVDGVQKGAYNSYTFENVNKNHTISVAFAPKQESVNDVKMDKIITTEEARAIAVAELKDAEEGTEGRSSKIITPEEYAALKKAQEAGLSAETGAAEGDVEVITVPQEQNLIGMDDTDNLGTVVDIYNPDMAKGVYQSLDITEETAEKLIDGGGDDILINEAYELGYLDILINNEYVVPGEEEDVLNGNRTVKNLQEIIKSALTKEDKLKMIEGKEVVFSFTISGVESPGEFEKHMLQGADGVKVDEYLYITLMKTVDGVPSLVEELDKEMEIVMEIPESLRDKGKKFCIVRNHYGEVDVLHDLDDDPDTITIKTDRFSPYALGHESGFGIGNIAIFIAIAAALLVLIIGVVSARKSSSKVR